MKLSVFSLPCLYIVEDMLVNVDCLCWNILLVFILKRSGKEPLVPQKQLKWAYLTWNQQMDAILISTLFEQITEGNKGDEEFKPQAYKLLLITKGSNWVLGHHWTCKELNISMEETSFSYHRYMHLHQV